MKGGQMKIDKGMLALVLSIGAGILTTIATILEVQDTIDECKDAYREEIRELVNEEFENRTETS